MSCGAAENCAAAPAGDMHDLWIRLAASAGVPLDSVRIAALERYLSLLLDATRRVNLTAIDDLDSARLHHIADSLTLLRHVPATAATFADVGSGGGVPGIPLAICRPDMRVTLIDSTRKKARLLSEFAAVLGLHNATVICDRAEAVARGDLRETFDVVAARALARLDVLLEWCMPLARVGGRVLAMKGPRAAGELAAARRTIELLGGEELFAHAVEVPELAGHVIIEAVKRRPTPARYPRR